MKATPVLVLYKGKAIEKVAIGEQKEIVGNGVVGTEIDLTGITIGENHELRMYVWEDITKLTPVLRKPGVLKPIIQ